MVFEMEECGGCRTCEIACSFHHTGEFKPSMSSIQIEEKGTIGGYEVVLIEKSDGNHLACDGCKDLEMPLCAEYCKEPEILKNIINDFLAKSSVR